MVKKAVILAAGYEKKLTPLTDEMHQCLFSLGHRTILEDMLTKLENAGVTDVVIVVGHKAKLVREATHQRFENLNITYIENEDYRHTGVSHSLSLAAPELDDDFLLIDGDMIVEEGFLKSIIDSTDQNLMAVDYSEHKTQKDIVVAKVLNGKIVEVGKHIEKKDEVNFARFLGISKFSKQTAALIIEELTKFAKEKRLNEIYETAVSNIAEKVQIKAFNSRKFNWFEVDDLIEFEKAKKIFGDTDDLKQKAFEYGADDVYIILPSEIIFDERALLQCYNCKNYGNKRTCPPNLMDLNYKEMIRKYKKGLFVVIKFDASIDFDKARTQSTNNLHQILLRLEKEAFTQDNHFTISFIGGSCKLCPGGCADVCRNPQMSRIPIEAMGIDVVETMKKFGLSLKFPAKENIYRVGLILIG